MLPPNFLDTPQEVTKFYVKVQYVTSEKHDWYFKALAKQNALPLLALQFLILSFGFIG